MILLGDVWPDSKNKNLGLNPITAGGGVGIHPPYTKIALAQKNFKQKLLKLLDNSFWPICWGKIPFLGVWVAPGVPQGPPKTLRENCSFWPISRNFSIFSTLFRPLLTLSTHILSFETIKKRFGVSKMHFSKSRFCYLHQLGNFRKNKIWFRGPEGVQELQKCVPSTQ